MDDNLIPVVYELDDDNEASGHVYQFCSDACADNFRMENLPIVEQFSRFTWGNEVGARFEEDMCVECGTRLPYNKKKETIMDEFDLGKAVGRFSQGPLANLDKLTGEYHDELGKISLQLLHASQYITRVAVYVNARAYGRDHAAAVKEQNAAATKLRKAFGYSYPKQDISF